MPPKIISTTASTLRLGGDISINNTDLEIVIMGWL